MTATVEFTGRDLAEAIAAAAEALDLPPEKLKFNVIDTGTKGFLGLGRRRARIAVAPDDPTLDLSDDLSEDEPAPPAAKDREPALEPEAAVEAPPQPPEAVKAAPVPAKPIKAPPVPPPVPPPAPARLLELIPLTRPAAGEARVDNPEDETALLARTVVAEILSRLGLTADLTLVRLGSRLVVNLDGPDRALLIGARGATLEALQLLAAKIIARKRPGEGGRLVLDVADYRFRRHNQVMDNLKLQVETARKTGRTQPLAGLNAAERRLVRLALRPLKDIELKVGPGREGLFLSPAAPRPSGGPGAGRPRRKPRGKP